MATKSSIPSSILTFGTVLFLVALGCGGLMSLYSIPRVKALEKAYQEAPSSFFGESTERQQLKVQHMRAVGEMGLLFKGAAITGTIGVVLMGIGGLASLAERRPVPYSIGHPS